MSSARLKLLLELRRLSISLTDMKQTTVCYISRGDEYLMIHRIKKENDVNRDKWIGVGGKLEYGESPFDCIRREVLEETGLTLTSLSYRGIITFVSNEFGTEYMHLFTSDSFFGNIPGENDEGKLEWIKKGALRALPMWEGDKIFLDLLEYEKRFFSLKLVYDGERLVEHKLEF